jgi:FkbM family methyltransferase
VKNYSIKTLLNFGGKYVYNLIYFYALKFGWSKKQFKLKTMGESTKFLIRLTKNNFDELTLKEVWGYNVYHLRKLRKDAVVLDLGANIGEFSVLAAIKNDCVVYAFEPDPENYGLLLDNIRVNRSMFKGKIIPINKAVYSKTGNVSFYVNSEDGEASSIVKPVGKRIMVDAVSLLDFTLKHKIKAIDFLKVDVEGSEYEILLKLPLQVLKNVNTVAVEYHNIPFNSKLNATVLTKFFMRNGFTVTHQPNKKMKDGSILENHIIIAMRKTKKH